MGSLSSHPKVPGRSLILPCQLNALRGTTADEICQYNVKLFPAVHRRKGKERSGRICSEHDSCGVGVTIIRRSAAGVRGTSTPERKGERNAIKRRVTSHQPNRNSRHPIRISNRVYTELIITKLTDFECVVDSLL